MIDSKSKLLNEIDFGKGYIVSEIANEDFIIFKKIINNQFQRALLSKYPEEKELIEATAIEDYHTLTFVEHKDLWLKEARTFHESDILVFKSSKLFKNLEATFGPIIITNEDKTRSHEIYWRLVRPNKKDDVGPLHADSWFWDLHNGAIDNKFRRLKIWASVFNETGKNGFRLITGSQKKCYEYKGELRDGKMKPVNDMTLESEGGLMLAPTKPGQFILFHDDLIHGGGVGGNKTRVSFELTILIGK